MIPDFEDIVGSHLRDHPEVQGLGARVLGTTPSQQGDPWVRVLQVDPRPVPGTQDADHLIACMLQLDCYAGTDGGQEEASALTRTVRAALREMPQLPHDGAVITAVRFASCPRIPDSDFSPARERYALTATVYGHSTEDGS